MASPDLVSDVLHAQAMDWSVPILVAAVAVGRLPGEPPTILEPRGKPSVLASLFRRTTRTPLSDPALEVVRAISASLANGAATIRGDLLSAAFRAGLTSGHLRTAFPWLRLDVGQR
jgi:hypothetical protein